MKKIIFLGIIVSFLSADPSAFGAGDLDSDNPYGLTKDEQYIWKNKQNIKKLQKIIVNQQKIIQKQTKEFNKLKLQFLNYKMEVDTLSQKIAGIESLLPDTDAINKKIISLKDDLNSEINSTNTILFTLKDEIENIKQTVGKNKKIEDDNIKTIINLVEQLAQNLDKLQTKFNKQSDYKSWNNSKVLNSAINDFRHSKLTKSKEKLLYLYNKQYNLGVVLFYLGEIEYKLAHYKMALAYYKKTIALKKKPTYILDDLLYHTGYSFEKLGNKKAARQSYLKLIHDYPQSILVKYAKKRVDNL